MFFLPFHNMACNCDANRSFGYKLGSRVGGFAGDRAQKMLRAWTGFGDYDIKANSLVTGSSDSPVVIQTQGRETTIRFKEYIGDIATHPTIPGEFWAQTYNVNPANVNTFPWLSSIAMQFDQYKPRGVLFEFKSTASDNSSTSSVGSVIIATEYDVTDADYNSKSMMLNSAYSNEVKMSDNCIHGIECDPEELQRKVFYTRPVQLAASVQVNTARDFDMCKTTVATQGGSIGLGVIVGSLYVHYEFSFYKEQPFGGIPAKEVLSTYYEVPNVGSTISIDFATQFAANRVLGGFDMGLVFSGTFGTGNRITIPKRWAGAQFELCWYLDCAVNANSITPIDLLSISGCRVNTEVNNMGNDVFGTSANMIAPGPAVTSCQSFWFRSSIILNGVLNEDAYITYDVNGFGNFPNVTPVGVNMLSLFVTIVPRDYFNLLD